MQLVQNTRRYPGFTLAAELATGQSSAQWQCTLAFECSRLSGFGPPPPCPGMKRSIGEEDATMEGEHHDSSIYVAHTTSAT